MAMNAEHRSNPSPAMVTSPYERKILEWDDKLQTNKQTNNIKKIITNREFVLHTLYTLYYFILIFI